MANHRRVKGFFGTAAIFAATAILLAITGAAAAGSGSKGSGAVAGKPSGAPVHYSSSTVRSSLNKTQRQAVCAIKNTASSCRLGAR